MTKEKYINAQAAWVDLVELKPGDKVKVLRAASRHELGWQNSWVGAMDSTLPKDGKYPVVTVRQVHTSPSYGITLQYTLPNGTEDYCSFPFFVLEKIGESLPEPIKISREYSVTFKTDKSIEVGCQKIPFDVLSKIYETAKGIK